MLWRVAFCRAHGAAPHCSCPALSLPGSPHPRRCRSPMSGAAPAMFAPHPTTVIPAEAGIQVGFHGNERVVRGVGGHVGHHRWTRGFGVLYRGTDLDPRLRGDDGRRGVQRSAKGGSDRGVACFGVWRSAEPMVPLRTARVPRCRCRGRPTLAAVVRPCQALPPPCSPHTPPPSSPRRRGSRLVSTGMNGWSGAWAVMSAITGGPGGSAFFMGGRTWIPACAGMTV
jgi:hypothetical protein